MIRVIEEQDMDRIGGYSLQRRVESVKVLQVINFLSEPVQNFQAVSEEETHLDLVFLGEIRVVFFYDLYASELTSH